MLSGFIAQRIQLGQLLIRIAISNSCIHYSKSIRKKMLNTKRAQISLEYAVLIVCIVLGLVAMQMYITRSAQGRFRTNADSIGEQYAPGNTTSDITDTFSSDVSTLTMTTETNGTTVTTTDSWNSYMLDAGGNIVQIPETHTRSGSETVMP